MKNISVLLFLVAALAVTMTHCTPATSEQNTDLAKTFVLSDTMLTRIALDTAVTKNVISLIKVHGKVAADESKVVEVYPFVGGNVMAVNVELGDYVQKGKVLAIIKSGEVADFERQLIDAENDVLMAEKNLNVQKDLFEAKLASEREYFAAQKAVTKAEAELNRIKEVFKIYSIDKSSQYIIHAPMSGFIIEKNINRDMTIRSDKSDNLFTIAQTSEVFVSANIYETDIAKIRVGMPVEIKLVSFPDEVICGKIDKVFTVLDPATRTMKVRIKIPNDQYKLKPEMAATVKIINEAEDKMLSIPSQGVIFDDSKSFAIVFKDRFNIETREIIVDHITDGIAYVQSGLLEGEVVVSHNQLFIYDALND